MKDAYWFKHDSNASRDCKLSELRAIYGYEGLGVFWAVIEVLREQNSYKWDEKKTEILAKILMVDSVRFSNIITDCKRLGLLEIKNNYLFSNRLCKDMKVWESKKGNRTKRERKPNESLTKREDKRRGEKIKEEKIKKSVEIPELYEFLDYAKTLCEKANIPFQDLTFSLESKYQGWRDAGWKDGNGAKIQVWKSKLANTLPHLKPIKQPQKTW